MQMAAMNAKSMMVDIAGLNIEEAMVKILDQAYEVSASDLFIVSNEEYVACQVKALGIVHTLCILSAEEGLRLIQHTKATASMDVGERRRPQDGRLIHQTSGGQIIDLRINAIPSIFGEDIAMRLLIRNTHLFKLDALGLLQRQMDDLTHLLDSPSGMVLCTGPTGSGKTNTLYAALSKLNDGTRKINTIEDPVEFTVDGLRQSQINSKIDVGFSDLLRSVLRQSPDVIMVGEIRDSETAEIAVRAANSGHMVFSTLHAPVAAAAIQSMRAFGVHPHFLSSALRGIVSQRLARTLCEQCKVRFDISAAPETFSEVEKYLDAGEGQHLYAPKGCEQCQFQGYSGRTGIFEVMTVSTKIRKMIADNASTRDIRDQSIQENMIQFRQAALVKVAKGLTSTEEVFRVVPTEHLESVIDD